jgi:hypothetical protein
MEWLCEPTPEEIARVGRRTNTMRELESAVRKYVIGRIKRRNIYNKDDYLKKKSYHKRVRWFERHLLKHVAARDRDTIREQFRSIVRCIQRLRLQRGRNIVRYKFYLLRLASMNGIKLRDPPEDIRTQKIINTLEDRLYGKVFVELGWKPEKCTYYNNWKNRNT